MQEENRRLIDEALENEPIKNTFRLTWEFIVLNKNFTFTAMGIFIVLNLLTSLPLLAIVFVVFAGVFGVVIQMHVGRTFYATQEISTYVKEIQESRIDEVLTKHVKAAFGVYLGWLSLLLLIIFVLSFMAASAGLVNQNMNKNDMLMAITQLGLPVLLLMLVFTYVQPLVQSNIILANTFKEGFKAVFTLFSKDVWSSAMKKGYFAYIAKIGLLLIAIALLLGLSFGSLVMLPLLGSLVSIVFFMAMYLFMVFMSIMSMMARRIIEE